MVKKYSYYDEPDEIDEENLSEPTNTFSFFLRDREGCELLATVYKELKEYGKVSDQTKRIVTYFFEDMEKFVNEYRREERRKAGCSTYYDKDCKIRMTKTGELE